MRGLAPIITTFILDGHGGVAAAGGWEKENFSAVSGSRNRMWLSYQLQLLHPLERLLNGERS